MASVSATSALPGGSQLARNSCSGGGDSFPVGENVYVIVENDDASPNTATFTTTETVDGNAVDDRQVTIAANDAEIMGPFPAYLYDNGSGEVDVAWSNTTSNVFSVISVR